MSCYSTASTRRSGCSTTGTTCRFAAIAAGSIKNRAGEAVTEAVHGALVREDDELAYPVRDDIPVMLIDEQIALSQLG